MSSVLRTIQSALRAFSGRIRQHITVMPRDEAITGLLLLITYYLVALFGFQIFAPPSVISPAAGIGLAGLFLGGLRLWPVIYLASLISYITVDASLLVMLTLPVAHTLQAFVGAYLLHRLLVKPRLATLRDMIVLIPTLAVTAVIVPTTTIVLRNLLDIITPLTISSLSITWAQWWTGMATSLIIVVPLIIRWSLKPHNRSFREYVEASAACALVSVFTILLFWTNLDSIGNVSIIYLLLIPLFWSSIRLGPRITISLLSVIALLAILGPLFGFDQPETITDLGNQLFQTQLFLLLITSIFLVLVAAIEERKDALIAMRGYAHSLESDIRQLAHEDEEKNRFVAALAHELRNPLAPVFNALELLRLRLSDKELLQLVHTAEHQAHVMRRLLEDVLDVTRVAKGSFELEKEPAYLKTLITHSLETVRDLATRKEQTLSVELPYEDYVLIVDPIRFEQVIVNLLSNAIKYTDPGGTISLHAEVTDTEFLVRIKDTGIGISPQDIEEIFMPFYRVQKSDRLYTGLGIGLSISKHLVELHGGVISARSAGPSLGSEFAIRLPRDIIEGEEVAPRVLPQDMGSLFAQDSSQLHILIVDDNKDAALGIAKLLEHLGHKTCTAGSGQEALESAREQRPHLIFLDIGLPDMDGFRVAQTLRSQDFTGRLVALSGYSQEEERRKAASSGFDGYLVKPASLEDLQAEIEQYIEGNIRRESS